MLSRRTLTGGDFLVQFVALTRFFCELSQVFFFGIPEQLVELICRFCALKIILLKDETI